MIISLTTGIGSEFRYTAIVYVYFSLTIGAQRSNNNLLYVVVSFRMYITLNLIKWNLYLSRLEFAAAETQIGQITMHRMNNYSDLTETEQVMTK